MKAGSVVVTRAALLVAALLAAVILATAVSARPSSRAAAGPTGTPAPTLATNRSAAAADASRLLAALRLPARAASTATEPAGGGSWLRPLGGLNATSARFDVHAWWRVPESAAAVFAYVRTHRPAGSRASSMGDGTGPSGQTAETIAFNWPAIPRVIGSRELSVTVTSLPGGAAGVLAQAESVWIVPRLAGERIPADAHELDVSRSVVNGPTLFSRRVTNVGKVQRLASLLNALPTVQPYVYSCPALIGKGAHLLTFSFRTHADGALLARAAYTEWPGLTYLSEPCNPISLSIGGHRWTPLVGGRFVAHARRILGFRFAGSR